MIYAFDTKPSTKKYIEAFCGHQPYRFFNFMKTEGDMFYDQHWPELDEIQSYPENTEFVWQGIVRGTKRLQDICKQNNLNYYYFDQPYFFYSNYQPHKDFRGATWYRIIKNNVQMKDINEKHKERFDKIYVGLDNKPSQEEITLKEWQRKGDEILVIPPSIFVAKWYGISSVETWIENTVAKIKEHTDRPINVRYKFKNKQYGIRIDKPLIEDINNAYAMISYQSMCACEAVVNGLPSFCDLENPASPVSLSLNDLDKLEKPILDFKRDEWLWSLLGNQFTFDEMKSGFAYKYINGEIE